MNKMYVNFICLCLLMIPLGLTAAARNTFEVRSAAFVHQSKKFSHIYDRVNADFQLESCTALTCSFELWGELDYMSSSKKKKCYHTTVNLTNCSIGIQYVHSFCPTLDGYIGTGLSMAKINLHNRSCCNHDKESKLAWGSLSKLGVRYWFYHHIFLDVFTDYLYQEAHFKKHVNLGGIKAGIGIGIGF